MNPAVPMTKLPDTAPVVLVHYPAEPRSVPTLVQLAGQ